MEGFGRGMGGAGRQHYLVQQLASHVGRQGLQGGLGSSGTVGKGRDRGWAATRCTDSAAAKAGKVYGG